MATKKQQRRRQKIQRHEYVYVDEEGNEVEPPAATPARAERKPAAATAKGARGRRPVKPPTWIRAAKWAGAYAAFMVVISVSNSKKGSSAVVSVVIALALGVLILPAIYWMQRLQYRTYLRIVDKQSGKS
jgi:hypothetical protein